MQATGKQRLNSSLLKRSSKSKNPSQATADGFFVAKEQQTLSYGELAAVASAGFALMACR
jgi:hypothetical protein